MAIPDYQTCMMPLLVTLKDGNPHPIAEIREKVADALNVSIEERNALLPSGKQTIFENRVGWAYTYLKKSVLLSSVRRGTYQITLRGSEVLAHPPARLDVKFLDRFPEFLEFRNAHKEAPIVDTGSTEESLQTPEESLERAYQKLRDDLAQELLSTIKSTSPKFFENLVVDLLLKMGYGGSRKEAGEAIGRTADEGIDGIIKEDRLGLDIIYIQAKRWEGSVGRPEVQKFAGALQGQRAKKGVFITTSAYTLEALNFVSNIDAKIILIDGQKLTDLMIDHNVGVNSVSLFELKRLDMDYFSEE
jgi:restriction system protein